MATYLSAGNFLLWTSWTSLVTTAEGAGRPGWASWAALQVSSTTPRQGNLTIPKAGLAELDMLAAVSFNTAIASRVALLPLNTFSHVSTGLAAQL